VFWGSEEGRHVRFGGFHARLPSQHGPAGCNPGQPGMYTYVPVCSTMHLNSKFKRSHPGTNQFINELELESLILVYTSVYHVHLEPVESLDLSYVWYIHVI
jgi:hypothetical protein